ncbi:MAG: pectate lyase [Hyphomonas sp.]
MIGRGLRATLAGVMAAAFAALGAGAEPPLSLEGFRDAIHHRQMKHGGDYPRHDPSDTTAIADNLLLLQRDHGGWAENRDPLEIFSEDAARALMAEKSDPRGSFDNRNVYTQIEYLMGAHARLSDARYLEAASRGFGYLLRHQFPDCGGWPHSVPAGADYQGRITIADEVFSGPLTFLRAIAEARPPLDGFNAGMQARAAEALAHGEACLLRLQVRQNGRLTGWAGQYDPETLTPKGGRSFELPAIVSEETVEILRYLMSIETPSPEVIESINAAAAWLSASQLKGWRLETVKLDQAASYTFHKADFDRRLVADAGAPPLWARFYDLEDNSVVLANRDGVRAASYDQIHPERRTGYSWYGTWPADLLETEYPRWHCRVMGRAVEGASCN